MTEATETDAPAIRRPTRWRRRLMLLGPVVVLAGAGWVYLSGGRYETTENAQIQAAVVAVAPGINGRVDHIAVRENQAVRAGDVLFSLSSRSLAAAVAEAEAELSDTRTDIASRRADYQQALADLKAAEARLSFARSEAGRQQALLREGIASESQVDAALTAARTSADAIGAARARVESLAAALSGTVSAPADVQPDVRRAAAKLERARSTFDDSVLRAPFDGVVTRVNQLQPGSYVTAGRPVFMLTGRRFWVVANFKENQLRHMRVGQPATITVDAYPGFEIKGRVASFSPGTGTSFSVLPAENATGNWVKVVQRLPVEIAIDSVPAGLPLSMGLSAEVTVDTGHRRSLFGADETAPAK